MVRIAGYNAQKVNRMDFEGFTFTPPGAKKELTPEERKARALEMLDKPLDEVINQARAERGDSSEFDKRKSQKNRRTKAKPKIIKLQLSEREVERYVRQFSDIDVDGCDIRLRLVMTKDSRW